LKHFISKISAITSSIESGPSAKRKKNTQDTLQKVQQEGKTKARRNSIFAAGKSEGKAEGTELGRALGLAEGIGMENEILARENASLRTTNEALHNYLCDTLEQSNGVATENLRKNAETDAEHAAACGQSPERRMLNWGK
jgi:flagellar biosynthesis/type III secretory pathway protein FliH